VLLLQLHDPGLDLERQLVGLPVGPPAAVGQAVQADLPVAAVDLVAGLAGDAEFPA